MATLRLTGVHLCCCSTARSGRRVVWLHPEAFPQPRPAKFAGLHLARVRNRSAFAIITTMSATPTFVFVACQFGAESALKVELARTWPELRFAYSRPGFVTFKHIGATPLPKNLDLRSTFARTQGFSLGKVQGDDPLLLVQQIRTELGEQPFDAIHAWQRDTNLPGHGGFEPGITPLAADVGRMLEQALSERGSFTPPASDVSTPLAESSDLPRSPSTHLPVNQACRPGQTVLDCVLVEPNQWWFGWHRATTTPTCWPGGVPILPKPAQVISRAYWKLAEALAWMPLPLAAGDLCVEIGCAPGGAAQLLLEKGLRVIGIDPAEVAPSIFEHPRFEHWKKRAADIRRKQFRKVKWLFADSNVAPQHTLDAVGDIVTYPDVDVQGLVLTLKLPDWQLAEQIPDYVAQVKSWGLQDVRTRQLAFNRQEICLAAYRTRWTIGSSDRAVPVQATG